MTDEIPTTPDPRTIKVLDHGFVRLVDAMGSDLSIVRAARVSYDADWRAGRDDGSDEKLLAYLLRNRHTSPFEAVTFTFEVKAPLFVLRQWHRHRTWSYNEVSARYTELPEEVYLPDPRIVGVQSTSNKQMRDMDDTSRELVVNTIRHACESAFVTYKALLKAEVPRELARSVLPLATYSRMFATVNLHNLMHFLDLRRHAHAQYEIRVYAEALRDLAALTVPVTMRLKYPHAQD